MEDCWVEQGESRSLEARFESDDDELLLIERSRFDDEPKVEDLKCNKISGQKTFVCMFGIS